MNRRGFLGACAALLSACGKQSKIRFVLNWKPDPQFGGFYAAPYATHGLNVEVLPGGAGTPTAQMIGAGSAEFGIVSADELVVARSGGNDLVALFAVFQNCPQGIMAHASRNLASIGDVLKEGTLAIQSGLPYARILKKKYGFDHVKVVPSPGGDISAFLRDEKFAQQCFVMSEPLLAKHAGDQPNVSGKRPGGFTPNAQNTIDRIARFDGSEDQLLCVRKNPFEGWRFLNVVVDQHSLVLRHQERSRGSWRPDGVARILGF